MKNPQLPLGLSDSRLLRQLAYVDGAWEDAADGARLEVDDPATAAVVATVPCFGAADTTAAIDAAERAFAPWRDTAAYERHRLLHRMAHLMRDHQADLALIMSLEQGKPLAESVAEIEQSARYYEWFAEEARRHGGEIIPGNGPGHELQARREPIGVAVAITPWNFPASMIARKAGAALAAGCTLVVKPAEATPLSALAQAELFDRAGAPPGVINVITGAPQLIGAVLTADPRVRKLSFTGSTAVGRLLMQQCAGTLKRLSLELGGNAPFIVFADADLDAAVEGALASRLRNAGQTCVSANRILVEREVAEPFIQRLAERAAAWRMGRFDEPGTQAGPLINDAAVAKVQALVAQALEAGARLCTGGQLHARGGRFWQPTVLADVTADMRVAREESFGPVAPVLSFADETEAVAMANATEYGLAAYVYTRDLGRCQRLQRSLEVGMLAFNQAFVASETAPFGGVKASGFGREGSHLGLAEYQQVKLVAIRSDPHPPQAAATVDRPAPAFAAAGPRRSPAPDGPYRPLDGPQPLPPSVVKANDAPAASADAAPQAGMPQRLPPEPVRVAAPAPPGDLRAPPAGLSQPLPARRLARWPS